MFRKVQELKGESYEKVLEKSLGFFNPNNMNYLANQMGLGNSNVSFITGLRYVILNSFKRYNYLLFLEPWATAKKDLSQCGGATICQLMKE